MTQSVFDRFVRKWVHTHYETTPSSMDEIARCEATLGFRFPQAYVDALLEHGTPHVDIRLLGAIVDERVRLGDVSNFIPLNDIAPVTPDNYLGLPEGFIPFATDCMGNPLCFARADSKSERAPDAPVSRWDHDFQDFADGAPSFTALLESWIALPYPSIEKLLHEEWQSDICAPGRDDQPIWREIVRRHTEAHRHYHGLAHLRALKQLMRKHAHEAGIYARTPPHLAVWWHDAIYDPQARDNEERSADLARTDLTRLGFDPATIDETCRLILMTKNHWSGGSAGDGDYFLDADIAILGAPPAIYDTYAAGVRQEYAWAPDPAYRSGRAAFLNSALARPRLFRTDVFEDTYAKQARVNMRRELHALDGAAS